MQNRRMTLPCPRRALPALMLAATLALLAAPAAHATLPAPVRAALQRAELPEDALGVVVLPLNARRPAVAHRAEVAMQPASTIKLVTTAVALDRLGANHRGRTELLSAAPLQGEVLAGDLVLRGGVDPELGLPQLWALLAELRWQGIREIAGDVLLDRSAWRPARTDQGLPPFDEEPEFPYNVIPDALQLAGNLAWLELQADGEKVQARVLPPMERVELVNRLTLRDAPCASWDVKPLWRTPVSTRVGQGADSVVRIELTGSFPKHCSQRPLLQLMDRDDLADRLLRLAWTQLGGTWRGQARPGVAPPDARLLAQRESRPWGEVIRVVNKRSDNPLTRMLFLSLGQPGMAADPGATTAELATRVVHNWFVEHDIPTEGLVLDNGSGLSRAERITPMQMARVIQTALNGPYAPELLMSMPMAGVDGFMRQRFGTSAANQRARLKTGGLRNVAALAGMVLDADDQPVVMVAIVNHDQPRKGRAAIDALVEWIAQSRMPR